MWACFEFVGEERQAHIDGTWSASPNLFGNVPAWAAQAVMPLAFTVMAVRFFIQSIEDAVGVWTGVALGRADGRSMPDAASGEPAPGEAERPDASAREPSDPGAKPAEESGEEGGAP